jgi:hypothetical protein
MEDHLVAVLADQLVRGDELPGVAAEFGACLDPGVPGRLRAVQTDRRRREVRAESGFGSSMVYAPGSDSLARTGSSREDTPSVEPGFQETAWSGP